MNLFLIISSSLIGTDGFFQVQQQAQAPTFTLLKSKPSRDDSFSTSSSSSKTIVSSLTNVVNFFMPSSAVNNMKDQAILRPPPSSPSILLDFIKDDYIVNNYLWTGDIHTPAFEKDCRFTDPTLSFVGLDKFISNVQNLRFFVDLLVEEKGCRSDLLDISLNEKEGYVESRWNMVGKFSGLPWRPVIDVIGKTKFWYRDVQGSDGEEGVRVFFYDEKWEMPASKALLQLVTPGEKRS